MCLLFYLLEIISSAGLQIWTNGQFASLCDNYMWCPEKVAVSDAKWLKGFPKADAGKCVALQLGIKKSETGLINMKCENTAITLCIVLIQKLLEINFSKKSCSCRHQPSRWSVVEEVTWRKFIFCLAARY